MTDRIARRSTNSATHETSFLHSSRRFAMTRGALGLVFVVTAFLAGTWPARAEGDASASPIRVACVGDSITFGAGVEQREKNNYPVVLGKLLGAGYEVRNFGVSGATAQKEGDHSYWKTKDFAKVSEFQPNIVVLMLGTNDSKPQNWESNERYARNLTEMAKHFAELDSKPVVMFALPPPAFGVNFRIRPEVIRDGVVPTMKKVAAEGNYKTIDVNAALANHAAMVPDKIHPNAAGAKVIAETVAPAIKEAAPAAK